MTKTLSVWACHADFSQWTGSWRWQTQQRLAQSDKDYFATLSGQKRQIQFLAGRRLIYQLSKTVLKDPLNMWRDAAGRPQAVAPFQISISHSQNRVAVAIAQNTPVGIDIEYHKTRRFSELAKHYFAAKEAQAVAARKGEHQQQRFYYLWCIKEAVAKRLGDGIGRALLGTDADLLCVQHAIDTQCDPNWTIALACAKRSHICWHPPF